MHACCNHLLENSFDKLLLNDFISALHMHLRKCKILDIAASYRTQSCSLVVIETKPFYPTETLDG